MNLASLLDLPSMIVPDSVALIDATAAGGCREVTYGELREAVSKTAGLLTELGVGPGDRAGLFATTSAAALEALFAIASVGATAVPMNYRAADEEVTHLLADSGAKVVFAETRYQALIEKCRPASLDQVIYLDGD